MPGLWVTHPEQEGEQAAMSQQHNAASMPYVSETQARHVPMTTGPAGHTHDHASFGASDHDDGVHEHRHVHTNDAMHNHDHADLGVDEYYSPPDGLRTAARSAARFTFGDQARRQAAMVDQQEISRRFR